MFWIEESPTNAADDDSDVPFDESPGKPMACEQEIELIIKPDDGVGNGADNDDQHHHHHLYPAFKSLDVDEDTWPETLSAFGGTNNTHDVSTTSDEDEKDNEDSNSSAIHEPLETIDDDDVTQVMGEHHTIEGPEDERTFNSAQDASFVYLSAKVSPEASEAQPTAAETLEDSADDQAEASSPLVEKETPESSMESEHEQIMNLSPDAVATTSVPTAAATADDDDDDDEENCPPALVSEPAVVSEPIVIDDDDDVVDEAENDVASMSESSETKPLNEMNQEEEEQQQQEQEQQHDEVDWYDQWQALEETDDGISCISNMFAPVDQYASRPRPTQAQPRPQTSIQREEVGVEIPSLAPNPTMITVFSDGATKSIPAPPQAHSSASSSTSSSSSSGASESSESKQPKLPMNGRKVILIFEGDDDNNDKDEDNNMTLTEFLNANCMQGSRKERRMRIMERQRNALSRITPVVSSASAPGSHATGGGPGFFDHFFESFDPMQELQNIGMNIFGD